MSTAFITRAAGHVREGFVGLVEGVARDHRREVEAGGQLRERIDVARVVRSAKAHEPYTLSCLRVMTCGLIGYVPRSVYWPSTRIATVAARELEAFRHRAGDAGALQHHVRAATGGRLGQDVLRRSSGRVGEDVDVDIADADLLRQLQAARRTTDDDRLRRAGQSCAYMAAARPTGPLPWTTTVSPTSMPTISSTPWTAVGPAQPSAIACSGGDPVGNLKMAEPGCR